MIRRARLASTALAASLIAGCTSLPGHLQSACGKLAPIAIVDGTASTILTVMTYNIEGLPWPARGGRARQLDEIGRRLAADRATGNGPDVVFVQEAFSTAAGRAIARAGYANRASGPTVRTPRGQPSNDAPATLANRRKVRKGEALGPVLGGGLYILSDYAIVAHGSRAFRKGECAGYDCLAKKGVQWARIRLPGVPAAVDLFNTHLQSRGAAGVSRERSYEAHRLQVNEVSRFMQEHRGRANPMIFGGDFNMRNSVKRFDHFDLAQPWPLVHRFCVDPTNNCRVLASWDGDEPWMDTQDLLGFDGGQIVSVRPVQVEARFDEPWNGRPLADHDALLVTYRLSWPVGQQPHLSPASMTRGASIPRACSS